MNTSASNQPSAAKTVFISYSHEDRVSAEKLAAALQEAGIAVIIDSEMRGGQEIQRFIKNSIKSADVTISLVSENSLLSGWVAKETVSALDLYKEVSGKEFIGCYLDENFFNPDFRLKATKTIDEKIAEIDELFPEYSKGKLDFKDLHTERSRLIDLRKELGVILSELKNSLTLDLRDQNFDRNVAKLIADIQSSSGKPEPRSHGFLDWLQQHFVGVLFVMLIGAMVLWAAYKIPMLNQIEDTVEKSSQEFLRLMGEQDAGAISKMVEVPFFFGDEKFINPEKAQVQDFFSKLFEHADAGTEQDSDNIQIRLGAALSRYFSREMKREDIDVFKIVKIEDIEPDLQGEKEEDRGDIPEPRVGIGNDGARASVRLPGYKPLDVMYLFFSARGDTSRLRGILLRAKD